MSSSLSNTVKNAAKKLLSIYLFPLRSNPTIFHQVKGIYFLDPSEHLYRATRHIDRLGKEATHSTMIDIGAAHGTVTEYFSDRYPNLKITCVEANPHLKAVLEQTFSGNQKVTIKSMALGKTPGESELHITANQLSSSLHTLNESQVSELNQDHASWLQEVERVSVKVSTLDQEFESVEDVLLLKLDTQGTEKDILEGGVELLKRTKFVLTEMNNHQIYDGACQYFEVDEYLRSQSFRLVDLIVSYHTNEEVQEYDALYQRVE